LFAQKAADIVALYLILPQNGIVLLVDERPHNPGRLRTQPGLAAVAQGQGDGRALKLGRCE